MEIINNPTHDQIKKAAKALKDGHLVAFPTETVYGLGADATNEKAVSRIYSVKGRPTDHPLIVHISSINQLDKWAIDIPDYAIKLAQEFWPGPMTLILPRKGIAKDFITGGQANVGLRIPDQPIALALIRKFEELGGKGIAAPSANKFGAVSPTSADDVREDIGAHLGINDLILDGGRCDVGLESTIIDCTRSSPYILRPGFVTSKDVFKTSNSNSLNSNENYRQKYSGNFVSHYSPKASVVIDSIPAIGDGFLALASIDTPAGSIRLSSPKNSIEFAKVLYKAFRVADKLKIKRVNVILPTGSQLIDAIEDRVRKASTLSK